MFDELTDELLDLTASVRGDRVGLFAMVIDCGALVVPIACAANVSDVGVNVTAGAPAGGGGTPPPPPPPLP